MEHIVQAVVASTFAANQHFIPERTPYILSREAVEEVSKQINKRRFAGSPVSLFLHPPKKSNSKMHDLALQTSLVAETTKEFANAKIGQLVSCEIQESKEFGVTQAVATIFLTDDGAIENIKKNVRDICPILNYDVKDLTQSLKKVFSITTQIDNGLNSSAAPSVSYLYPPLTVIWCHVALKRSVSNPYLMFL